MSAPRVSVVVFARRPPSTLDQTLRSLESQRRLAEIEVILADGTEGGMAARIDRAFPWVRRLPRPKAAMPELKGAAIRAARAEIVAMLDPVDAAEPDWVDEILSGLADEEVAGVGGSVIFDGAPTAANRAAYLFEYGAFCPPVAAGPTEGDLPGNNVAYRRRLLEETCGDLLDHEGFYKPLVHRRLRESGGRLVIRPSMRVRHLAGYGLREFSRRCFHHGRCFGATRRRRSTRRRRLIYGVSAPLVPGWLVARHLLRSRSAPATRRLLSGAAAALVGICIAWGLGEWAGCWLGPGRSCDRVF